MGYHTHHAIIVTSWKEEAIKTAHAKAVEIFSPDFGDYQGPLCWVSPISPVAVNGYQTFLVGPDGSKEGWDASDEADNRRAAFIAWMKERREPNHLWLDWAEVAYYDEGGHPRLEDASSLYSDEEDE